MSELGNQKNRPEKRGKVAINSRGFSFHIERWPDGGVTFSVAPDGQFASSAIDFHTDGTFNIWPYSITKSDVVKPDLLREAVEALKDVMAESLLSREAWEQIRSILARYDALSAPKGESHK